jgi:hypothetical protein
METIEKELVKKILELTRQGKLKWRKGVLVNSYTCVVNSRDKRIHIYAEWPQDERPMLAVINPATKKLIYLSRDFCLFLLRNLLREIIPESETAVTTTPPPPPSSSLFPKNAERVLEILNNACSGPKAESGPKEKINKE